jgi:hypothetical protein
VPDALQSPFIMLVSLAWCGTLDLDRLSQSLKK